MHFQLLSSSAPLPRNKTTYSWTAGSRAILDVLDKIKWGRKVKIIAPEVLWCLRKLSWISEVCSKVINNYSPERDWKIQGRFHLLGIQTVKDTWMKSEYGHWWNDNDRGKLKHSEETLLQWHFVYHKMHVDWPKEGSESARWATGDRMPQPSHGPVILGPTNVQVSLFHCWTRQPFYCTSSNRQVVLQRLMLSLTKILPYKRCFWNFKFRDFVGKLSWVRKF